LRPIGAAAHARWIAPLKRVGLSEGRLILEAPSAYHAAYVERQWGDAIRAALRARNPAITRVDLRGP
jgi:hypothetical protein